MTETLTIDEIYDGYIQWIRDTPESERYPERGEKGEYLTTPAVLPDKVALAAVDTMFDLSRNDATFQKLLTVFRLVDREFNKGFRCSACGEADDPDYDHGNNC